MGEKKRRAKALAAGLKLEVVEGGKTKWPAQRTVELTIPVAQPVSDAIRQLYEFVKPQYASRTEFLEDLLREGLRVCLEAHRAALAAIQAAKDQQQNLIVPATAVPSNIADLVLAEHARKTAPQAPLIVTP